MQNTCPICKGRKFQRIRGWRYSKYEVTRLQCANCGEHFNAYYKDSSLKFTIADRLRGLQNDRQFHTVAIIDEDCRILKERQVHKTASLLPRDVPFKVFSVGTVLAMLKSFENTVFAREILPFVQNEDPRNYVLFVAENNEGLKDFLSRNNRELLDEVRLRVQIGHDVMPLSRE